MFNRKQGLLKRIGACALAGVGLTLLLSVTASAQSDTKAKAEQSPTVQVFTSAEAMTDVVWITDTAGVQVFQVHAAPGAGAVWQGAHNFQPTQDMAISSTTGLRVMEVTADSPAASAGLQVGDIITALNGVALTAEQNAGTLLDNFKPGDQVTLSVQRGDPSLNSTEVTVTLGEHPKKSGAAYLGVKAASIFLIEATAGAHIAGQPLPHPSQGQFWTQPLTPNAMPPMMQYGMVPYGIVPYAMPPMVVCMPMMMPGMPMFSGMYHASPMLSGTMGMPAGMPGMAMTPATPMMAPPVFYWHSAPGMEGAIGADVMIMHGQPGSPAIQVMPLPEGAVPPALFNAQVGAPGTPLIENETVEDEM